jgi:hypothetical protein
MTFTRFGDGDSVDQLATLTLSGQGGPYYSQMVVDHPEYFDVPDFEPLDSARASWRLIANRNLAVSFDGSVQIQLCSDQVCQHVVWRRDIPYRLRQFTVDTSTLQVQAYEQVAADPVALPIAPVDRDGDLDISTSADSGDAAWLSTRRAPDGSVTVVTDTTALGPQTLAGRVHVAVKNSAGMGRDVPVAVTIGSGFVMPDLPSFTVTRGTTAAQNGTLPIAFRGALAPAWTATSDQDWLVLDDVAGTGASSLRYHVDARIGAATANWLTSTAHVTVHAQGLADMVVPVSLAR